MIHSGFDKVEDSQVMALPVYQKALWLWQHQQHPLSFENCTWPPNVAQIFYGKQKNDINN